jgi:hypothetical protein
VIVKVKVYYVGYVIVIINVYLYSVYTIFFRRITVPTSLHLVEMPDKDARLLFNLYTGQFIFLEKFQNRRKL